MVRHDKRSSDVTIIVFPAVGYSGYPNVRPADEAGNRKVRFAEDVGHRKVRFAEDVVHQKVRPAKDTVRRKVRFVDDPIDGSSRGQSEDIGPWQSRSR